LIDASSFSRPNGRMRSLSKGPQALARDRFKERADRKAAKRGSPPKVDAFAPKSVSQASGAGAFGNIAAAKPRAAATKSEPAVVAVASTTTNLRAKEKRAELHVVASNVEAEPAVQIRREEFQRAKQPARSSSLVLVSASNVVAAAEAPAETGPPDDLGIPTLGARKDEPKQRSGGGSGGGAAGGGAGGGASEPPRDRIFNQDDLVSALLVIVMLILLLLYLIRPGGQVAPDDRILNTQFAATEPEAPPAPPPDPFGVGPVDLTPKSPMPPPSAEPSPAPAEIAMHAWFCTAQSELTQATIATLDRQIADLGPKLISRELVVLGYADTRGPSEYNLALGAARASAVADYLKAKGVKVAATSGVGELPDLADNQNCANQRRVDVRLFDMPDEPPDRGCAPPRDSAELMCR
jgi:outer membrane protein OmpA-like peptidoglycan-associated protein